jgi:hypothetical protein
MKDEDKEILKTIFYGWLRVFSDYEPVHKKELIDIFLEELKIELNKRC